MNQFEDGSGPALDGGFDYQGPARQRIACFGGVYSNYLALQSALEDARRRVLPGRAAVAVRGR